MPHLDPASSFLTHAIVSIHADFQNALLRQNHMVEHFFRDVTTERLRRGVFRCVPDLILAIKEYIAVHNQEPKPFV